MHRPHVGYKQRQPTQNETCEGRNESRHKVSSGDAGKSARGNCTCATSAMGVRKYKMQEMKVVKEVNVVE